MMEILCSETNRMRQEFPCGLKSEGGSDLAPARNVRNPDGFSYPNGRSSAEKGMASLSRALFALRAISLQSTFRAFNWPK